MTATMPDDTMSDDTVPADTAPGTDPRSVTCAVCRFDDLEPERGVAALIGDVQVAVFRLHDDRVVAVDHHDPFSGANVIARGIVGSRGDIPTVASPMFKQVFDLLTGTCLDDPAVALRSFGVEIVDGLVRVTVPAPDDRADR